MVRATDILVKATDVVLVAATKANSSAKKIAMNSIDMSKSATAFKSVTDGHDEFEYRSISKAAIVCVVFAIIAALAFLSEVFVLFPLLGVCFGAVALTNIRKYPDELIGKLAAQIGTVVCALCFAGAVSWHAYVWFTEVPEGYQRISFSTLNADPKSGIDYSEEAVELDGKNVFVRGYVRPGAKKTRLKKFILVGDFGSCCFGGDPDIWDIVAIDIKTDKTVDYGFGRRKIGGKFKLNKRPVGHREKDIPGIVYEIEADHIK